MYENVKNDFDKVFPKAENVVWTMLVRTILAKFSIGNVNTGLFLI